MHKVLIEPLIKEWKLIKVSFKIVLVQFFTLHHAHPRPNLKNNKFIKESQFFI